MSSGTDSARLASLAVLELPFGVRLPRRGVIVAGIMLGIFLSAVEGTVVGTALPSITGELHGLQLFGYVVTGYLVTSTVSVPAWGKLSDNYGRLPFYVAGILLFLLGSALSGAVPLPEADPRTGELGTTMPWLIAFRGLQGLGGAGAVLPVGLTMVADIFDVDERAKVQGWLSSVWGLASVVGPAVGGIIVAHWGWRWVFYINIPFGLLAAILVGIAWREPRSEKSGRVRVLPLFLMTSSLALALVAIFALSSKEAAGWLAPAAAALALGTGVAFVALERRAETPVLDLSLFSEPMFRSVAIGAPFSGVAMFAAISFAPLFVQGALGGTPQQAGSVLGFLFVPWMLGSVFSPTIALRVGLRKVAVVGGILCTFGYALLSRVDVHATYAWVAASMVFTGIGMGLTIAPLFIAVQTSVERARRGAATALTQFARSLGGTLGVAVIGAVLATGITTEIESLAPARGISAERVVLLKKQVDQVVKPHGAGGDSTPALTADEHAVLAEALARALGAAFSVALGAAVFFMLSTFIVPRDMRPPGGKPDELPETPDEPALA